MRAASTKANRTRANWTKALLNEVEDELPVLVEDEPLLVEADKFSLSDKLADDTLNLLGTQTIQALVDKIAEDDRKPRLGELGVRGQYRLQDQPDDPGVPGQDQGLPVRDLHPVQARDLNREDRPSRQHRWRQGHQLGHRGQLRGHRGLLEHVLSLEHRGLGPSPSSKPMRGHRPEGQRRHPGAAPVDRLRGPRERQRKPEPRERPAGREGFADAERMILLEATPSRTILNDQNALDEA